MFLPFYRFPKPHLAKPLPVSAVDAFDFPVDFHNTPVLHSETSNPKRGTSMQLKGEVTIRAPRKKVWDFLTDPNQIGQCMPGVEKIETIVPLKKYRGVVSVGLGSVKARFNGDVEILELDEPNRAKLKAHGTATGSAADAVSEMSLSDGPDNSTLVQWTADINVSGQLASLVSRLMVPVSQKLAGVFYDEVRKRIEKEE